MKFDLSGICKRRRKKTGRKFVTNRARTGNDRRRIELLVSYRRFRRPLEHQYRTRSELKAIAHRYNKGHRLTRLYLVSEILLLYPISTVYIGLSLRTQPFSHPAPLIIFLRFPRASSPSYFHSLTLVLYSLSFLFPCSIHLALSLYQYRPNLLCQQIVFTFPRQWFSLTPDTPFVDSSYHRALLYSIHQSTFYFLMPRMIYLCDTDNHRPTIDAVTRGNLTLDSGSRDLLEKLITGIISEGCN